MEFLKHKTVFLVVIALLVNSVLFAQEYKKIKQAFEISYDYESVGDYSSAADALKIVYDEESYEINLRLGWLTYMSGNFTESIAFYQKAIDLKPYAFESRFGLVYPASAVGNWAMVTYQYQTILTTDPLNTLALYRLGMIHYGVEEYDAAAKHFQKVVDLYPFDYDSLIMLAWSKFHLGQLSAAKVLFQKVLLFAPSDSSALEGLDLIK